MKGKKKTILKELFCESPHLLKGSKKSFLDAISFFKVSLQTNPKPYKVKKTTVYLSL